LASTVNTRLGVCAINIAQTHEPILTFAIGFFPAELKVGTITPACRLIIADVTNSVSVRITLVGIGVIGTIVFIG